VISELTGASTKKKKRIHMQTCLSSFKAYTLSTASGRLPNKRAQF